MTTGKSGVSCGSNATRGVSYGGSLQPANTGTDVIEYITMSTRGNANVIDAMVPLANMFGYVNNLRSLSQGRANYSMQFDHYEQVPSNVAEEVKAKLA